MATKSLRLPLMTSGSNVLDLTAQIERIFN